MLVDTNVLIRHLTGDPPGQARRATAFLAEASALVCPDLVVAEVVYVLESFYGVGRAELAELVRSIIVFPALTVDDDLLLLRALDVYETARLDFADAYLVASAERLGDHEIASFDRAIDRMPTLRRVEPGRVS